jgi:hypothetical protein
MRSQVAMLYASGMAVVIVSVDLVFFRPILGAVNSKYWHRLGVHSFLLEIPRSSMFAMEVRGDV